MAVRRENKQLSDTLQSTANLDDGTAPFHADRGNITTGAAVNVAGMTEARQSLRTRKGLDQDSAIDIEPRWLVVAPDRETTAEQLVIQIQAATVSDVNPFSGRLGVIVDNGLALDSFWYLAADPSQLAALVIANLESAPGSPSRKARGLGHSRRWIQGLL